MLRLLLDQHVANELYERLVRSESIDVERVRDIDQLGAKADDPDIWRYAVANNQVVVTNDQHFVDGTADPEDGTHPGVIRYVKLDWPAISEAIENIEQAMTTDEVAGIVLYVPASWIE